MKIREILQDTYSEVQTALDKSVEGLETSDLLWQPQSGANHIAFNLWHMLRVEDHLVQHVFQRKTPVWLEENWFERMNICTDTKDNGYGYITEQINNFPKVELNLFLGYRASVKAKTSEYLKNLSSIELEKKVLTRTYGEVSANFLLSHMFIELAQHIGQMDYIRGLKENSKTS